MTTRTCVYLDDRGVHRCTECGQNLDLCTCVQIDNIAHERLWSPDGLVFRMIQGELRATRKESINSDRTLAALGSEFGRLCLAMLQHEDGQQSAEQVLREAIQVASTTIRVATEGDSDFNYEFPHQEI